MRTTRYRTQVLVNAVTGNWLSLSGYATYQDLAISLEIRVIDGIAKRRVRALLLFREQNT
jgi:hypothetical protein